MNPPHPTVFEVLKDEGYHTYLATGIPFARKNIGWGKILDAIIDDPSSTDVNSVSPYPLAPDLIDEFLQLKEEPYFAWFQIADTHQPYATLNHPFSKEVKQVLEKVKIHKFLLTYMHKVPPDSEKNMEELRRYQIRSIRDTERYINLLAKENADIILTADHGENCSPQKPFGHGYNTLDDELCHIPLCIRTPHKPGDTSKIISLTQIPNILLSRSVFQDWAIVEFLPARSLNHAIPRNRFRRPAHWFIPNRGTPTYKDNEAYEEQVVKRIDPGLSRLIQHSTRIIEKAHKSHSRMIFACSGGKSSSVLIHLGADILPTMHVVFVDTGCFIGSKHIITTLRNRYEFSLNIIKPNHPEISADRHIDKTDCCASIKGNTLSEYIENQDIDVILTGAIRDNDPAWVGAQTFTHKRLQSGYRYTAVRPIIKFRQNDIWAAIRLLGIPHSDLYNLGYTSIDCRQRTNESDEDPIHRGIEKAGYLMPSGCI
jgi:phosphoadenosine phosphosulfate reductase